MEDVFRVAFEKAASGIAISAPSGDHLHTNRAFCEFVGYSADELQSRRMLDLTHPDDWQRASTTRDRLVRAEIPQASGERRFIHKSGLTLWALVTTTLVRDQEGDPAYFVSQVLDITDRRHAEDALRSAETRFRALIGAMRDVIVVLDRTGRYVDVAPSATELLHRLPTDLLGKTLHDVFSTAQADRFLGWVHEALEKNVPVEESYDLEIRGEQQWFDATMLPQGRDRVVWISRDATQRRRAEIALRESEEQLRQAQKMEAVGQLAGGVAHDFNNMLMAIMSNAELASLEIPASSGLSSYIDEIKNASRRARSLTQQLLAFSRKQMLQPLIVDLNDVVRESQLIIHRLMGPNIAMDVVLDPALGRVRADPGQLSQVLINLAVNGRDAMANGGQLSIATENREIGEGDARLKPGLRPGRYAAITVRDTGTGMRPDVAARVFEPFFTTKPLGQGTGLGLSTAYGVIKQSGGYIDVTTALAVGTTFTVLLPSIVAPQGAVSPPTGILGTTKPSSTILLVDDDPGVRDAAKRMLIRSGFMVVEATNGAEAIAYWDRCADTIDVVLTDVVMPSMDGTDMVRALRKRRPGIRVIFMSGYTHGGLEIPEADKQSTRFLAKPFSAEQLVGALVELLQSST